MKLGEFVPETSPPRCSRCGAFTVAASAPGDLCEECYCVAGTCCPEFGADDLWDRPLDSPADQPERNVPRPAGGT